MKAASEPVTVVVRRSVKAGFESKYEDWLNRLTNDAKSLAGYLGAEFHRSATAGRREYVSVFRFDNLANLEAFERSGLRQRYLAEVALFVEADAQWERMTGLEFWFSPPAHTKVPQPSPFRMSLLLIAVVFILVLMIGWSVDQILDAWPYPLRLLITITLEVFLMTYLLMPRLTRLFARWIYPN